MASEYKSTSLYSNKALIMNQILDKNEKPVLQQLPNLNEKVCFFSVASTQAFSYAIPFWKSMTKFHSPKEIDMILYTNETNPEELKKLPKGIIVKDLTPYLEDQAFFYRQKPILGEELLKEYDLVVGFDADQLVLSKLDDIIKVKTYDVGVVINYNRFDEKFYPLVHQMPFVQPIEYYNCGLVAMRSKKFVHHWKIWCFSPNFDRCQYKEQDGLNILTHHGNYNVYCFDIPPSKENDIHWYGIISKGELVRAEIKDNKVFIPKGLGGQPFPPNNVWVHLIHTGGGAEKQSWNTFVSPSVIEYIEKEILQNE